MESSLEKMLHLLTVEFIWTTSMDWEPFRLLQWEKNTGKDVHILCWFLSDENFLFSECLGFLTVKASLTLQGLYPEM